MDTESKAARLIQIYFAIAQSGCPQIGMSDIMIASCLDEITVNLQAGITQSDGRTGAPGMDMRSLYSRIYTISIKPLYIFEIESGKDSPKCPASLPYQDSMDALFSQ